MKYDWVIFDADETLFHFDAFAGLKRLFQSYDVVFTKQDYDFYQQTNQPLWLAYQQGEISAKTLQVTRFNHWANKLNVSPEQLNTGFLNAMAQICKTLPGARRLLELLSPTTQLMIITNGFTALQQIRLEKTALSHFFEHVIISEQVGVAKPDVRIFEHAFSLMGNPDKSKVLMIGDTLSSDIQGGKNAGIDTCWINHDGEKVKDTVGATYQVACLTQLYQLLNEHH